MLAYNLKVIHDEGDTLSSLPFTYNISVCTKSEKYVVMIFVLFYTMAGGCEELVRLRIRI